MLLTYVGIERVGLICHSMLALVQVELLLKVDLSVPLLLRADIGTSSERPRLRPLHPRPAVGLNFNP
jgi:hypothetical protein